MGKVEYPEWFLKAPYRPPAEDPGEKDQDSIHLLVGYICHNWEALEGILLDLYLVLIERSHPAGFNAEASLASYGALVSPTARRDVIEALVKAFYSKQTSARQTLTPLLTKVGRAIGRRNEAAHGLVVTYNHYGFYLMPPRYTPLNPWDEHTFVSSFKYRYNRSRLEAINSVLETLMTDLETAVRDLKSGAIGPFLGKPLTQALLDQSQVDREDGR